MTYDEWKLQTPDDEDDDFDYEGEAADRAYENQMCEPLEESEPCITANHRATQTNS